MGNESFLLSNQHKWFQICICRFPVILTGDKDVQLTGLNVLSIATIALKAVVLRYRSSFGSIGGEWLKVELQ